MNRFKKFIEKITTDAIFLWPNMTFDAIFDIHYTPCKFQNTLKNNKLNDKE